MPLRPVVLLDDEGANALSEIAAFMEAAHDGPFGAQAIIEVLVARLADEPEGELERGRRFCPETRKRLAGEVAVIGSEAREGGLGRTLPEMPVDLGAPSVKRRRPRIESVAPKHGVDH